MAVQGGIPAAWNFGRAVGGRILGQATTKLKNLIPNARIGWQGLTHGMRPVANNSVSSIVKAAPVVTAAPTMTRGVLHPLSLLGSTVKAGYAAGGLGLLASGVGGVYDFTSVDSVGKGRRSDLNDDGTGFKDKLDWLEQARLRAGAAIRLDGGGVFGATPDQELLEKAQGVRNEELDRLYGDKIAQNQRALQGIKSLLVDDGNFNGLSVQDVKSKLIDDGTAAKQVEALMGIDGGIEKITELGGTYQSPNSLRAVATNLNKENLDKQEAKLKRQQQEIWDREDDKLRIERERQDATQRLQLMLGDRTDRRIAAKERRAREDRQYYDMLNRKDAKAERAERRAASERQQQREMIQVLLSGLGNY